MNHYPHHLGDYAKDTVGLTQGEHGAYVLLIFAAYSAESGIDPEEVYAITKAAAPAERKSTERVLKKYWHVAEDGLYHQRRIDEEIAAYQVKAERNRLVGKSGGRPRTNPEETQMVIKQKPKSEPKAEPRPNPQETLASNQEPIQTPVNSAFPVARSTPDSASTFAAAALQKLQPPKPEPPGAEPITLAEARIDSDDATPAGTLSAICIANGIRINPFHPLVVEWAREGVTIERLKSAIATARQRKPAPESIPAAYLDKILQDHGKPSVDTGWKRDDAKAMQLCQNLGIPGPKRGEEMPAFHARIEQALRDNAMSQVQ